MSYREIHQTKVRGRKVSIGFGNPGKTKGKPDEAKCVCEMDRILPHRQWKDKVIVRSKKGGRGCSLLSAVSHELLHLLFPDLSEDAVSEYDALLDEVYPKMLEEDR